MYPTIDFMYPTIDPFALRFQGPQLTVNCSDALSAFLAFGYRIADCAILVTQFSKQIK
jgi:hypothetical protein